MQMKVAFTQREEQQVLSVFFMIPSIKNMLKKMGAGNTMMRRIIIVRMKP